MNDKFPVTTATFPNNPQLKLCLSGLGVLCFSKDNNRAEIGYLHLDEHDAMICMLDSKDNYLIPLDTSFRGKSLEVITPQKGMGECYFKEGQAESFASMLDLSEIYGEEAEFKNNVNFQSKIFIDDAVFFTEPKSVISVEPFDVKNPHTKLPPMDAGTGLWAHTKSRNITVKFNGNDIPLKPDETYDIRIWSRCPGSGESDFKYFYNILQNAGNTQYNLGEPENGAAWFTEYQLREFEMLAKRLNEFFVMKTASGGENQADLIEKLRYLIDILCAPKPCISVTFANKPRNLP